MSKQLVDEEEKKDGSNHGTTTINAATPPVMKSVQTKIADGNWVRRMKDNFVEHTAIKNFNC